MKTVSFIGYRLRHLTGDRISVLSDGELHIRDIRDEDKYSMYTCVARNILTGDEKPSKAAYLHVHGMSFYILKWNIYFVKHWLFHWSVRFLRTFQGV